MMAFTSLGAIDWSIIIGYSVIAIGIGIFFSKRASGSLTEYFVAGRRLTWWAAGTSIVATSFAADTPLVISGWMRTFGLQRNWYWWSGIMAMMLCTFFYARLWRRARIITDVEFTELRYHGKPAAGLRLFHALFRAVISNCLIMGWVILAAAIIMEVVLDLPTLVILKNLKIHLVASGAEINTVVSNPDMIFLALDEKLIGLISCILIALSYSVLSGLWGVVATDLIQFAMAMVGSIALAVVLVVKAGGPQALVSRAIAALNSGIVENGTTKLIVSSNQLIRFTPSFDFSAGKLAVFSFLVFISLQWLGGGQGGGFLAQRLFSVKDERQSLLAMLWYNFAHFVLRPWPWIIVGVASLIFLPKIQAPHNQEYAYPIMVMTYLPVGLKGLTVASLLAAFMSTMDTHMHFGASYMINDFYKRFIKKNASERHYVMVSRLAIVALTVLAGIFAYHYKTIASAWFYFTEIMAGAGLVILLRWYWWRINVWSEISAMASSLILANTLRFIPGLEGELMYPVRLTIIIGISTVVWLVVTFFTPPVSQEHLEAFYRRVRPAGWWGPIAKKLKDVHCLKVGWLEIASFFAGVACIFTALFGVGWLCLGRYGVGIVMLIVSAGLFWWMFVNILKMDWEGVK